MSSQPLRAKFVVRSATPADAEDIARVQNAALVHINLRMHPQSVEDPEGWVRYQVEHNRALIAGTEGLGMAWLIARDPESDEIVSVMRTSKVEDAVATPQALATSFPFGGPEQSAFSNANKKAYREKMGSRPHYYVHIMATHPDHQGRGVARALLQHIADLADHEACPIYLNATPEAKPVYSRFGWVETGVTRVFPTGAADSSRPIVLTSMLREPRARVA